jgi:hypothetical protein
MAFRFEPDEQPLTPIPGAAHQPRQQLIRLGLRLARRGRVRHCLGVASFAARLGTAELIEHAAASDADDEASDSLVVHPSGIRQDRGEGIMHEVQHLEVGLQRCGEARPDDAAGPPCLAQIDRPPVESVLGPHRIPFSW